MTVTEHLIHKLQTIKSQTDVIHLLHIYYIPRITLFPNCSFHFYNSYRTFNMPYLIGLE